MITVFISAEVVWRRTTYEHDKSCA